jgi:hypothetical protein
MASVKHGTLNAYRHRHCRCTLCRRANAQASMNLTRRVQARQITGENGRPYHPDAPHGTRYGYSHFGCRCEKCRRAQAVHCAAWRAAARLSIVIRNGRQFNPKARHGTTSGYNAYGCRCPPCSAAR